MNTHLRRRGFATVATFALAGATATVLLGGAGTASAAARPDLAVSQRISGSSTSGHTYDTITVKNIGDATASHINFEILTNTSGAFGELFSGTGGSCEVMPAPAGFNYAAACQFSGTLAPGHATSIKGDLSSTAGHKFTNYVQVGDLQGDSSYKNNVSTVTSWFGPRADLAVGGTAKTGTKTGHATAVTTLVNHGPNNASAIQETVEIKGGATSVLVSGSGGSCQIIPPASGYTLAASCVANSLTAGSSWKLTFDYKGTSGKTITMVTKVSALTIDPLTTNNSMTRTAKLK